MRLFEQIPECFLIFGKVAVAKIFSNFFLSSADLFVLLHLTEDVVTPRVELVEAAHLEVDVGDVPVVEVILVIENADLVDDMKPVRPIEVEKAIEDDSVAVKVELVLSKTVGIRQLKNVLVCVSPSQFPQPGQIKKKQ